MQIIDGVVNGCALRLVVSVRSLPKIISYRVGQNNTLYGYSTKPDKHGKIYYSLYMVLLGRLLSVRIHRNWKPKNIIHGSTIHGRCGKNNSDRYGKINHEAALGTNQ